MAKLITRGKGISAGSIGELQIRHGDETHGLSAEFFSEHWNDTTSIRVDYKYLASYRGDDVEENGWYIFIYAIKSIGKYSEPLEKMLLTRIFVKSVSIYCPHCSKELGRVNNRWKCGNPRCHIDYSNDSCVLLAKINQNFRIMADMTNTIIVSKKDEKI